MSSSTAAGKAKAAQAASETKPIRAGVKAETAKVHITDTPITWGNWYKHVNWLNTTFIIIVPLIGFISAYWVPLQFYTAIFAVVYYFNTGLGITAGKLPLPSAMVGTHL